MHAAFGGLTRLAGALSCAKSGVISIATACTDVQRACLPHCIVEAESAAFGYAAAKFSASLAGRSLRKVRSAPLSCCKKTETVKTLQEMLPR